MRLNLPPRPASLMRRGRSNSITVVSPHGKRLNGIFSRNRAPAP